MNVSPFIYETIATGDSFIGRDKEVARLKSLIRSHKNALLYGPPKIGKRSIVYHALRSLAEEFYNVEVCTFNLFNIRTFETLLVKLARALIAIFAHTEQEEKYLVKTHLKGVNLDVKGREQLGDRQIKALLNFPQAIAGEYNVHLIVYLQQFQDILLFDKPLRALSYLEEALRNTEHASYIIVGDKRNAMNSIFVEKQFFRNLITEIPIHLISKKIFCDYICSSFKKWGKSASAKEAALIYDAMEGDPWYVQHVAEICFLHSDKVLTPEVVDQAVERLLRIHDYELHNTVYALSTHQIMLIKAILDGERKFSKNEVLEKYQLNSSANVNRLKEALTKKEIVTFVNKNTIEFNDSMLKKWLKEHFFA